MLILKSVAAGVGGFTCISLVGWCAFAVLIPVVKIGEYYIGCDMCVPCPGWYTLRGLNYKEICYGTSMYRKHAFRHFPPLCKSSGFCPLLHHLWCKVLLAQSHLKMALIFPVLLTIFLWEGNFLPPSLPVSLLCQQSSLNNLLFLKQSSLISKSSSISTSLTPGILEFRIQFCS